MISSRFHGYIVACNVSDLHFALLVRVVPLAVSRVVRCDEVKQRHHQPQGEQVAATSLNLTLHHSVGCLTYLLSPAFIALLHNRASSERRGERNASQCPQSSLGSKFRAAECEGGGCDDDDDGLCNVARWQNLIPSFPAPTPSTPAQSKERKGSNFAIWQHC